MSSPLGVFQIHYVNNRWVAKIENVETEYLFKMGPPGKEDQFVEEFANAMGEGPESVLKSLGHCIDYSKSYWPEWQEEFFNEYFKGCDELQFFNMDNPFTTAEGQSLADELQAAGEWLVEAIAA